MNLLNINDNNNKLTIAKKMIESNRFFFVFVFGTVNTLCFLYRF